MQINSANYVSGVLTIHLNSKSMFKEFQKFIARGNVIDLAVGIIIGGAFGKITSSLVSDIIMPPVGMLLAGVDFAQLSILIGEGKEGPVTINYGVFLQTVIDFLIIAFAIFMFVKFINKIREAAIKKEEEIKAEDPTPSNEEKLLTEIRDILKVNNSK